MYPASSLWNKKIGQQKILKIFISAPEPDMNEFSFVAEEIAETFMKAKDAHLLMAQDRFQNDAKWVSVTQ